MKLTKWPTIKALPLDTAIKEYGTTGIHNALARFLIKLRNPYLPPHHVERDVRAFIPRFNSLAVFHRIKFTLEDAQLLGIMENIHDVVHARPERCDHYG